jgi:hypothetical protein
MVKIKHKGTRTSIKTIVSYRKKFMRHDTAYSRLEGISDVIMNSVEMPQRDLVILHRLMQAWISREYSSWRENNVR